MGLVQRYFNMFDGEPAWLVLLASVVIFTGVLVILEKLLKISLWLLIVILTAGLVILVGGWMLFF